MTSPRSSSLSFRRGVFAWLVWGSTGCGAGAELLPLDGDSGPAEDLDGKAAVRTDEVSSARTPVSNPADADPAELADAYLSDAPASAEYASDAFAGADEGSADAEGDAPAQRGKADAASGVADASVSRGGAADASTGDAGAAPFKGVANAACNDLSKLGASWYYNWTLSSSCPGSAFAPMIWGHPGAEQTAAGIAAEMKSLVGRGATAVLGFNEPDNASQSNISVAKAEALWPALAASSVRLGSPATQANTAGQAWFKAFMAAVNADKTGALRVDFIAAHWYGWNAGSCDSKAANLESYIGFLESIPGNRPIWLTEWGCLNLSNPDAATVVSFYQGAMAMFAKHPRLVRYAWYPWAANDELVTTTDQLTSLGTAFAKAPAAK